MRRIARWEVLPPLWEAREHSDSDHYFDLYRNDVRGTYHLASRKQNAERTFAVYDECEFGTGSTVDIIKRVMLNFVEPLRRRGLRVERVV